MAKNNQGGGNVHAVEWYEARNLPVPAGAKPRGGGGGGGGRGGGGGGNRGGVPDFGTWGHGGAGSIFSSKNERNAAEVTQEAYQKAWKEAQDNLESGFEGQRNQYLKAEDAITAGANTARADVTQGRDLATGALYGGQNAATGALYGGQNAATGALTQGRDAGLAAYDPYVAATAGAAPMYANALGLGGPAGNAAAQNAFQTGPGYDFALQQGLQAIDRGAASRGMLGSGNTAIDALTYGQGLANQEYANWLERLSGQQTLGANIAGNRANLYANTGQNLGNVYTNTGQNLANVYTGTGQQLANTYTGAGNELGGIATELGARQGAIHTGLGDARYEYGSDLAGLEYATRLGQGAAQAGYLTSTDQTGANIYGAATGNAQTAANLLSGGGGGQSTGANILGLNRNQNLQQYPGGGNIGY